MDNLLAQKNNSAASQNSLKTILILLGCGITMFLLRTLPIHDLIFTNWPGAYGNYVNFSADDAVYHMRLVHNTIYHFPFRVFFDPFTHFPFGNQIHFGPLFTLIIAAISFIVGLGHPSFALINTVGAYTPVVMGVLCLIPVYFIARKLFGRTAALITVFILTFLPGDFLQRSSLGFTDHHVAEVLFSSFACTFLIYALDTLKSIKKFGIFTGIAFGLFILVWPAALMFGAFFLIFFISQLLVDHLKNNKTEYLLTLVILIYSIPLVMILPYVIMNPRLQLAYYSLTQPLLLILMVAIFVICYITHIICNKKPLTKDLYPLILATIFILIGLSLSWLFPKFTAIIQDGCKLLFEPTAGMKTVSEVRPSILNPNGDKYTILRFWYTYFWVLIFAVFGLIHLSYRAYKKAKPTEILFLTWTIGILLATVAQCRFNYYLAINIAILAGCYAIYPTINLLTNLPLSQKGFPLLSKIMKPTLWGLFIILTIDPMLMLLLDRNIPTGVLISREQYNTLIWLKNHTPDPQGKIIDKNFAYTDGYYPIPKNPSQPYAYPKNTYGIMSWWDIGHQITYIAERIPNTNPFQQGVIENNGVFGAAPFFISTNEGQAIKNLEAMGSRYVLIDNKTAVNIVGIGIWCNDLQNWEKSINIDIAIPHKKITLKVPKDSPRFEQSMLNRLYYNDANGLEHFRLIHESDGDYLVTFKHANLPPKHFSISTPTFPFKDYNTTQIFTVIN